MRIIHLSQGRFAIVDDDTFEWASKFKWHAKKARNTFYAARNIPLPNGKQTIRYLHREILGVGPGVQVDHADGNGLNNWPKNLRICSPAENGQNRPKQRNNVCGYKGVYFNRAVGKWRAKISANGRAHMYLGSFDTAIAAAAAYDRAAAKLHGEFAQLNF